MDDSLVAHVLEEQHGVISRRQALEAGLTPKQVKRRVREGQWQRLGPGVYRHRLRRRSWRGDLIAGVLRTGGLASHRASAALHEIEGFGPGVRELSVTHGEWRWLDGYFLHQSTQLDRADPVVIDGVRCTGLARTVLDVAAVVSRSRLESAVDGLLRDRRLSLADLWAVVGAHSRRGRDGCGRLREVLDGHTSDDSVPLSDWSRMVARLIVDQGLPRPRFEHRIHDDRGRFVAQVDLAYPLERVAIELDSVRWHLNRAAFQRDRERWNRLTLCGWTVLSFTWADYSNAPGELCRQVAAALTRS